MTNNIIEFKEFAKKKGFIGTKSCILTISDNIFTERDTENRPVYQSRFSNIIISKNVKTLIVNDKKTKEKHQYIFPTLQTVDLWYEKLQSIEIPDLTFLNDPAISINSSGIILELNEPFEKLFLYKKSELVGKDVVLLIDPTFTNTMEHTQHIRGYLRTGETNLIGSPRKVRGLQKGGIAINVVISLGVNKVNNDTFFTAIFKKDERDDTKSLIIKMGLEKLLKKDPEERLKSLLKKCADDKPQHDYRVGCKELDTVLGIVMIRLNPCLTRLVEKVDPKTTAVNIINDFENYGSVSIIRNIFDVIFLTDKNYYEVMYLLIVCPLLVSQKKNDCAKKIIFKINQEIEKLSTSRED